MAHGAFASLVPRITRRSWLRLVSVASLALAARGSASSSTTGRFGRARRCILLYLTGGPPQLDTWDLKPDAPDIVRGEFRPIATSVPGIQIGELFPRLARLAHTYCIVRSVTHTDNTHTSAGYTMLTGMPHPNANRSDAAMARPTGNDHPHFGALLALTRPATGVPPFVAMPEIIRDAGVNTFPGLDGGLLGASLGPFLIEGNEERTAFRPAAIRLPEDVPPDRLARRRTLQNQLAQWQRPASPAEAVFQDYRRAASHLIHSTAFHQALDIRAEPARVRERYGEHLFGQGCLMARRLAEAGVGVSAVYWHYEGPDDSPVWDTHENNFEHLRRRLMPPTDMGLSALLEDLEQRGMLDDTLVACLGEFGRTPRVNRHAGRDHWGGAQSIVLAGAGIRGGTVYGSTDREGGFPRDNPVAPADLTATFLHWLGVPADLDILDRTGRPLRACMGQVLRGL